VLTLFMTCLIVAAFVVLGGASVATRDIGVAEPVRVVEVEQGQTLWQIAASVAAPGETGDMVYRIRELNSLAGSSLVEGQELAVPLP
jgi:predicted Zn-dependent protease